MTLRPGGYCAVPSCGITNPSKWGTGPDGPDTLCNRCYNKYRNCELDIFQDIRSGKLSVAPSWDSIQVSHIGFHRKGGSGRQMNISRPIFEPISVSRKPFRPEGLRSTPAVTERRKLLGSDSAHQGKKIDKCLIAGCERLAKMTGPDGPFTLCGICHLKYAEHEMILYQAPHGPISVVKKEGWRRVGVTTFHVRGGNTIDWRQPSVEPWGTQKPSPPVNDDPIDGQRGEDGAGRVRKRKERTVSNGGLSDQGRYRKKAGTAVGKPKVDHSRPEFLKEKDDSYFVVPKSKRPRKYERYKHSAEDVIQRRTRDRHTEAERRDQNTEVDCSRLQFRKAGNKAHLSSPDREKRWKDECSNQHGGNASQNLSLGKLKHLEHEDNNYVLVLYESHKKKLSVRKTHFRKFVAKDMSCLAIGGK
eukprot:GFKZ01004127.1.p1 GENE.GFKZ01004127.1~~GFKZ01004127.1.p1  ORF type:complete len:416 (+),score=30.86 GFKZ01004127.1:206-1453(+)